MQYCFITPKPFLERYATRSTTHMVLAQLAARDQEYFNFYKARGEAGDVLIMDNGAYEGEQMGHQDLLEVALSMDNIELLVIPDTPNNFDQNEDKCGEFLDYLDKEFHWDEGEAYPFNLMKVIHATPGCLREFTLSYLLADQDPRISAAGFSRLTPAYSSVSHVYDDRADPLRRVKFAQHLKRSGLWAGRLEHHALGQLGGPTEIATLAYEGFDSMDSSAPVWRGIHGVEYKSADWQDYPFELSFNEKLMPWQNLKVVDQNIERVLKACSTTIK